VSRPAYLPDTTTSDFYLFADLKEKLQSVSMIDRDGLISATTEVFSDIPQCALIAVYQNWMK
jgi:hypothetical protein